MSTERLVRQALEDSVKDLPCPEPDIEQLLAAGRAARRRRVATVASLAAAAVLVLVLAGLSFGWAGRSGRALEPVPANSIPTPTPAASMAFPSELHQWIDALPVGEPPATPYWHEGMLYVRGEQIPAPYGVGSILVAGDTVLLTGYRDQVTDAQSVIVRGDRLVPVPVPAGASVWGLSVDGRIAYGAERQTATDTTRFFTVDTQTETALASRTMPGRSVELLGIDAAGNAYLQGISPLDPVTRWDVRADTTHPSDLTWDPGQPPEEFDGSVPWMHAADAYRSPDGARTLTTRSMPSDSPSDCCLDRLRVRPVGTADSVAAKDVVTLSIFKEFPNTRTALGFGGPDWMWWESNESVLLTVWSDMYTYLLRCSSTGGACQRVAELGPDTVLTDNSSPEWVHNWDFARAPVSQ